MEWLETDGLGGFAMGSATAIPARRYHGLLIAAHHGPADRVALVNGVECLIQSQGQTFPISTFSYMPGMLNPDGLSNLVAFDVSPWPTWIYRVGDGITIRHEFFIDKSSAMRVLSWRLESKHGPLQLRARPLLSGRSIHDLQHHNHAFNFSHSTRDLSAAKNTFGCAQEIVWHPYPEVPAIFARTNGSYTAEPAWYYQFLYEEDRARGSDHSEDLASPGILTFELSNEHEAILMFTAQNPASEQSTGVAQTEKAAIEDARMDLTALLAAQRKRELKRRHAFATPLHAAADAYVVKRGSGKTIIAGYPWFADWGRDTFISLRGLCLTTGRIDDALQILLQWSTLVSGGMLPNRFIEGSEQPEYNSVDAALWYIIAVEALIERAAAERKKISADDRGQLISTIGRILDGYRRGTRYNIHCDSDGLLAAGEAGVQLTWMDAKIGDFVVTPRTGKPVEVNALWCTALDIAAGFAESGELAEPPESTTSWQAMYQKALLGFDRFWNAELDCLYDVIDCDHKPGVNDPRIRPNQIFAVGGLPRQILGAERAAAVVSRVERDLLTPLGLRTLAPYERDYRARYIGNLFERDSAYHQGTVWPWLIGPFIEAWLRVHGHSRERRDEARRRFINPLLDGLNTAGLGHISEIHDSEPPFRDRGSPFQAWSVAEALRLEEVLDGRNPQSGKFTRAVAKIFGGH